LLVIGTLAVMTTGTLLFIPIVILARRILPSRMTTPRSAP